MSPDFQANPIINSPYSLNSTTFSNVIKVSSNKDSMTSLFKLNKSKLPNSPSINKMKQNSIFSA
jgi:hypothetical protein